ncbi:MAG: hypothetical protein AAE977_03775 [Thermoplasmataceae archaeon]|jgi:hypothetical protein
MGRSTPTVRQYFNAISSVYSKMESMMRSEDIPYLQELIKMGKAHSPEVSTAGMNPEIGFIVSILIEMMKNFDRMKNDHK